MRENSMTPLQENDTFKKWQTRAVSAPIVNNPQEPTWEAIVAERRRLDLEARIAKRLLAIPTRYRSAKVTNDRIGAWLERESTESLLLTGPTGTGKTHAIFGMARWLVENDRQYRYYAVPHLMSLLRPNADVDQFALVEELRDAPLLFLDDLGAHKASEWTEEQLFQIADARYMWERPTVFATNLPPKKLSSVVGDRLASRIAESCIVIPLTGNDRRRA